MTRPKGKLTDKHVLLIGGPIAALVIGFICGSIYIDREPPHGEKIVHKEEIVDEPVRELSRLEEQIRSLKSENTSLKQQMVALQEKIAPASKKEVTNPIPFMGDETSLAKVKANARDYVGRSFVAIGAVSFKDFYVHQSMMDRPVFLRFTEMREDWSDAGPGILVYARRSVSKPLLEEIRHLRKRGFSGKMLRARITLVSEEFGELVDWQDPIKEKYKGKLVALKEAGVRSWSSWALDASFIDSDSAEDRVKCLPFTGEETPLIKVTAANTQDYVGKTFLVVGGVSITNYYNYGYENARSTHVSLRLSERRSDWSVTTNDFYLYLRRAVSKKLIEQLVDASQRGYTEKLIRARITILPARYEESDLSGELLDWQFVNQESGPNAPTGFWGQWNVDAGFHQLQGDR